MKRFIFAFAILGLTVIFVSGCGIEKDISEGTSKDELIHENNTLTDTAEHYGLSSKVNIEEIEQIYVDSYTESSNRDERVQLIVDKLGNKGYVAIDSENLVNMTCPEVLMDFIDKQKNGDTSSVIIFQVIKSIGCNVFDMKTIDGNVYIEQYFYRYQDNHLLESNLAGFTAEYFEYTKEGYLIVEGTLNSKDIYVLTLDVNKEHMAFRVLPLEPKNRELCEKYILSVSYRLNNMFITNWDTEDCSNLDFYSLFEKFYSEVYGKAFPYTFSANAQIKEYEIPSEELENVILCHLQISKEKLREYLRYDDTKDCYYYSPRTFYEFDYTDIPYPEVVGYEEKADGSIEFLVNAVFPYENTSKLFSHKVTVTEADGQIYYLSNEILSEGEINLWWHANR